MTEFLRVRDKSTGHEYDAPVPWVTAWPDAFEVLDKEPVQTPREPKYAKQTKPAEPVSKT